MADQDEVQEKLEGVRRALLKNSIFFGIGWFVLMVTLLGLNYLGGMGSFIYKLSGWLMFFGWGCIGWPKIWIIIKGGGLGGALKADYEVVTYENGVRVSSDGGSQSLGTNFIMKIVQIGLLYVIGTFVQAIHLIILSIRYIVLHGKAKPKPAFIQSGLFIIVMNIAVLIGSPILGAVIQGVGTSIQKAAHRAATGAKIIGDFDTRLNEAKDGRIIQGYVGKGGDVVIPATIDGLPVVGIEDSYGKEFSKTRVTSVVIPETVTYIGMSSFSGCTELKQITLPKNLKFIEGGAFSGSGLTSVTIPEGVTDIGGFEDCKNLTSVTLPRSLQRVGSKAFANCTSLVNVTIPSGHTIQYGVYSYANNYGGTNIASLRAYTSYTYFATDQNINDDYAGVKKAFKGCTSLSAASRQAIEDSGYIGEF